MAASVCMCMPARVWAQAVALDMSVCEDPKPATVRALLAVELRDRLVEADAETPPGAQVVEIRCNGDAAELRLRGSTAHKDVALSSVPKELRARLLALSAAELARPQPEAARLAPSAGSTRTEQERDARPGTADRPAQGPGATPADPEREARVSADAQTTQAKAKAREELERADDPSAASSMSFSPPLPTPNYFAWLGLQAEATPLFAPGGSLLLRVKLSDGVAWSSAAHLTSARTQIDRGELDVLHASVRTGLAYLVEGSRTSLQLGAAVRAGWLRSSGEPTNAEQTDAAHFSALYLGPAVFAGATLRLAGPLFAALELELGHTLREVRANVKGGESRTLSPWRSSAVLGAGVAW